MTVPAAPISLDLRAPDLREQIGALPAAGGIYRLRPETGSPHLASSQNLRRRLNRLLFTAQNAGTLLARLRESVAAVDCWITASRLESLLIMHALVKQHYPEDYLFRLKLRIPWFVGLTLNDPFPRLSIGNRVPRKESLLVGPFPTRAAAQMYEQQVSGLFQIRRCSEILSPSQNHPGCVYGEMNQCLRPCQCAVTREEYASEALRMNEFLSTNGRAALAVMTAARDRAAEQTDFEQAAHIHKQAEKIRTAAAARDEVVTNVYHLNGIALTRGIGNSEFQLWPMLEGCWENCLRFEIPQDDAQAKSLDQALRELLTAGLHKSLQQGRRAEDLAIFARWYYSSWRDGKWFPFRQIEDLAYRKIVKEISSMAKVGRAHPVAQH